MKQEFLIRSRDDLQQFWRYSQDWRLQAPVKLTAEHHKKRRSNSQNAKMWAMLSDICNQCDWHGKRLSTYEWKDLFTAGIKQQKVVPGLEGGFVVLGTRTREMSTTEMAELIELMYAFGAEREVIWTDEQEAA